MIGKYYYKSLDFNWGNYGTDLGYVMTRKLLTHYEINKGVCINVVLNLLEDRQIESIKITILDTDKKYIPQVLNELLETKLNLIFKNKIKVENLTYIVEDEEKLVELINELNVDKCFGIKE